MCVCRGGGGGGGEGTGWDRDSAAMPPSPNDLHAPLETLPRGKSSRSSSLSTTFILCNTKKCFLCWVNFHLLLRVIGVLEPNNNIHS